MPCQGLVWEVGRVGRNWKWDRLSSHMKESKVGVESSGQDVYPGFRNRIWKLKWSNEEIPLFPRCWLVVFSFLGQSSYSSETPAAKSKVQTSLLSRFFSAVVAMTVIRLKFWGKLGHLLFERWSIALIQCYVKSCCCFPDPSEVIFICLCIYTYTRLDTRPKSAAGGYCTECEPWTQKKCQRGFILLAWHEDL